MNILFPIIEIFEYLQWNSLDIISQNNQALAQELKEKGMLPMSAQEIKQYVETKK